MKIEQVLQGQQISLRCLDENDAFENYIRWMNDEEVVRFLASRGTHFDRPKLQEFVTQANRSPEELLLGMFRRSDDAHIGNIKISHIHPVHRNADVGLVIGFKDMWGKGVATEAISLMTDFAFDVLGLHKLYATILDVNVGSLKAFLKAGYREVGRFEGHSIWEGTFHDWWIVEKCNRKDAGSKA